MTRIIAEACNNHMGDRRIMEAMIRAAAAIRVDTIKFQTYDADKLNKDWPNYEDAKRYYAEHQLSTNDHIFLINKCKEYKIGFLSTAFDIDSAQMLYELGQKEVKIASPDANNWGLIDKCFDCFEHIIISTGMHTDWEIEALKEYANLKSRRGKNKTVTLLHCVSAYPASIQNLNLKKAPKLGNAFIEWGFSDHSIGTDAAKIAIAMGASVVEKHFTLNTYLPGKDQAFAGEVRDFLELINWRRTVDTCLNGNAPEITNALYKTRWVG